MVSATLSVNVGEILPALPRIMLLSAVKIRKGRMNELMGSEPDMKSVVLNASAKGSFDCRDVIWQSRMSSPPKSAITNAGRFLLPDKSEKGKGMITTSLLTNLSTPYPPPQSANLLPRLFGLQNGFRFYRIYRYLQKPCLPVYAPTPTTAEHYFLVGYELPMLPSLAINF